MGRWTQYDGDEYRLPEGMKRIGYDADTGRYYFRDRAGIFYRGPQGSRFGQLTRVPNLPIAVSRKSNGVNDVKAAASRSDGHKTHLAPLRWWRHSAQKVDRWLVKLRTRNQMLEANECVVQEKKFSIRVKDVEKDCSLGSGTRTRSSLRSRHESGGQHLAPLRWWRHSAQKVDRWLVKLRAGNRILEANECVIQEKKFSIRVKDVEKDCSLGSGTRTRSSLRSRH